MGAGAGSTFDRGFMTIDDAGRVIVSDLLDPVSRQVLELDRPLWVQRLVDPHRAFLAWHREHGFRGAFPYGGRRGYPEAWLAQPAESARTAQ